MRTIKVVPIVLVLLSVLVVARTCANNGVDYGFLQEYYRNDLDPARQMLETILDGKRPQNMILTNDIWSQIMDIGITQLQDPSWDHRPFEKEYIITAFSRSGYAEHVLKVTQFYLVLSLRDGSGRFLAPEEYWEWTSYRSTIERSQSTLAALSAVAEVFAATDLNVRRRIGGYLTKDLTPGLDGRGAYSVDGLTWREQIMRMNLYAALLRAFGRIENVPSDVPRLTMTLPDDALPRMRAEYYDVQVQLANVFGGYVDQESGSVASPTSQSAGPTMSSSPSKSSSSPPIAGMKPGVDASLIESGAFH